MIDYIKNKIMLSPLAPAFVIATRKHKTFNLNEEFYKYFYNSYNTTWYNERTVEIPIAYRYFEACAGSKLEIGNVLQHYYKLDRTDLDIVDRFEKGYKVINEDILTFSPNKKYNAILSISTMEHIGQDYGEEHDGKKLMKAFKHVIDLLAVNGEFFCTMPIGENPVVDKNLELNRFGFDEEYYMKRISEDNKWVQCLKNEALEMEYGKPYDFANAIVIGIIHAKG